MAMTIQARRLKELAVATGVPKAFISVKTESFVRQGDRYYGMAWGHLTCKMEDMYKYATKLEQFPDDLVVTRHYSGGDIFFQRLISVHFEEKINKGGQNVL